MDIKKTPTETPNAKNAKKFKTFIDNMVSKEAQVQQLLSEIKGKEIIAAGKGHCLFLSFYIALRNKAIMSRFRLMGEEEVEIDVLKKEIRDQYLEVAETFYSNFDGVIREFPVR